MERTDGYIKQIATAIAATLYDWKMDLATCKNCQKRTSFVEIIDAQFRVIELLQMQYG